MQPSNQDKFCEALAVSKTAKTATDSLDWHSHGDDIMHLLSIVVLVTTAMAGDGVFDINLETSDDSTFATGVVEKQLATGLAAASLSKGKFPVSNAPIPTGLKRYNRIAFTPTLAQGETMTTAPAFTAFIVAQGRQHPLA